MTLSGAADSAHGNPGSITRMSAPDAPSKTPWYKKWWIWAIVVAVVVIGGISNLVNGDAEPQAQPTSTIEPAPIPTASDEPEPSESPSDAPSAEDQQAADAARSAEFEQAVKDAVGGQEFSDILASDPSLWAGWISGIRVEGSNAYITLQIANNDPAREDFGGRAASALPTLLPADAVEGISWIIIEDASGAVIEQTRLT